MKGLLLEYVLCDKKNGDLRTQRVTSAVGSNKTSESRVLEYSVANRERKWDPPQQAVHKADKTQWHNRVSPKIELKIATVGEHIIRQFALHLRHALEIHTGEYSVINWAKKPFIRAVSLFTMFRTAENEEMRTSAMWLSSSSLKHDRSRLHYEEITSCQQHDRKKILRNVCYVPGAGKPLEWGCAWPPHRRNACMTCHVM